MLDKFGCVKTSDYISDFSVHSDEIFVIQRPLYTFSPTKHHKNSCLNCQNVNSTRKFTAGFCGYTPNFWSSHKQVPAMGGTWIGVRGYNEGTLFNYQRKV